MKTLLLWLSLSALSTAAAGAEQENIVIGGLNGINLKDTAYSHEIVLALSGGGARGLASIGIIKAFEEKNFKITAIAGTSMGGVIGGLYACGYSPDELSAIVNDIEFNNFFANSPDRGTMLLTRRQESERHLITVRFDNFKPVIPQAWAGGQKIMAVLNQLTGKANYICGGDFSKLPIPFKTVATDVVSGQEIIIDKGSISEAMRATMAFPLALAAVESNGFVLMDGGMVTPVPVAIAHEMNDRGRMVVAVNTASKLSPKEELKTPFDIAGQVTTIMTADKMAAQLKLADYVIEPPLGNLESSDFEYKDSLIAIGYQAGLSAADSILKMIEIQSKASELKVVEVKVSASNNTLKSSIEKKLADKILSKRELIKQLKEIIAANELFQIDATIIYGRKSAEIQNINLNLTVQEGLRVSQYNFYINGCSLYEVDSLAKLLVNSHDRLTSADLRNGLKRLEQRYHQDGHDAANVRSVDIDFYKKTVEIELDEAIIRSIDVEENKRTLDWLVRSYFPIKVGEPYSTEKAAVGLANLYGTGLFDQIIVEMVPIHNGARAIIRVKERHYMQVRLGWHWDDDYKSEQFVELLDDNIRGMGLEYRLHAQYAEDRQKYFAQLKMDRIWFTYITARINAYHNRINKAIYDNDGKVINERNERRTGIEISMGQQVKRFGTVRGAFVLEKVRNRFENSGTALDFNQRILHVESMIETFDKLPFPNRGKKFHSEFRYAGEFLGGEVQYTKAFTSIETYIPLGNYLNFHPKISIGLSGSELPFSEQFFIGGAKSFSGYRAFEYAGDKVILLNSELRLKLPLNFYLIGRYDVGEVYIHTEQIKLRNIRHGWGAFLAINSPVGPFELGYGVADSDNDRFYVNIGLSF